MTSSSVDPRSPKVAVLLTFNGILIAIIAVFLSSDAPVIKGLKSDLLNFMKNRVFKGMEFIFNQMDTSKITGKTYLPIFINESLIDVYGDAKLNKVKEKIKANKTSGFNGNQQILSFVKDLYSDYNIYNNYLTFFDKSFTSPLSKTGIDVYNYVLKDSAFIDKKWCYNIVFYPRRKNELTFKGDFWVNDSTFAIKKINMAVTKSANINWVKDIYLEQEFEVVSDSVFLFKAKSDIK